MREAAGASSSDDLPVLRSVNPKRAPIETEEVSIVRDILAEDDPDVVEAILVAIGDERYEVAVPAELDKSAGLSPAQEVILNFARNRTRVDLAQILRADPNVIRVA